MSKIIGITVGTTTNPNKFSGRLTTAQINALDGMFKKCAYTGDVSAEYEVFKEAFGLTESGGNETPDEPINPEVVLISLSATYTGENVSAETSVNDLTGITVTATYSDGSTSIITDYTLSGEIVEGENTITVSYGGLTTTFTVNGVKEEFVVTLPEGYTQVEYLQSNGASAGSNANVYINTGYLLGANDDIKVTFAAAELSGIKTVLGSRDSASNFFVRCPNNSMGIVQIYKYGTTVKQATLFKDNELEVDEKVTLYNEGNIWKGVTNTKTISTELDDSTYVDCSEPLYLFCENNKGVATASYAGKIKMYDVEITNGGTMKAKFVPCKDASGVACMYECVSGTTLYNAGIGEFIVGGNVE